MIKIENFLDQFKDTFNNNITDYKIDKRTWNYFCEQILGYFFPEENISDFKSCKSVVLGSYFKILKDDLSVLVDIPTKFINQLNIEDSKITTPKTIKNIQKYTIFYC